ncbi:MAG: RsbRD N-terminal domain-containing protein [Desulforegulaceae bacterium]|nr:RsbRD N-terminal domain-containing protein [Desulforegulaceae bacterium]
MTNLEKHMESIHSKIALKWFDAVLASYPNDKNKFLARKNDLFMNPVGVNIRESIKLLLKEILKTSPDYDKVQELIDPIMRIGAVQEFGPGKAVAFLFSLKEILRQEFKDDLSNFYSELDEFSKKIDMTALIGFQVYMKSREKIFELKARHVKERTLNILKAKNILAEVEEVGTEIIPHEVFKKGGFEQQ